MIASPKINNEWPSDAFSNDNTSMSSQEPTIRSPRFLALSTLLDKDGTLHSFREPRNLAPFFSRNSAHAV